MINLLSMIGLMFAYMYMHIANFQFLSTPFSLSLPLSPRVIYLSPVCLFPNYAFVSHFILFHSSLIASMSSSTPPKLRPPKPPRLKKGITSVPNGHTETPPTSVTPSSKVAPPLTSPSPLTPPSAPPLTPPSPAVVPSPTPPSSAVVPPPTPPSSSVAPPPTPPFKPDGKLTGRNTSLAAAANITKALKKVEERRVHELQKQQQPVDAKPGAVMTRTQSDGRAIDSKEATDSFLVVDKDPSHNLIQENTPQEESPHQSHSSSQPPSSPMAIPLSPHQMRQRGEEEEEEEDNTVFTTPTSYSGSSSSPKKPLSPPKKGKRKKDDGKDKRSFSASSAAVSVEKKPLLPPSASKLSSTAPARPLLPPRPLRPFSTSTEPTDSPSPKLSRDSHVTPPKGRKESNGSNKDDDVAKIEESDQFSIASTPPLPRPNQSKTKKSLLPSNSAQTTPTIFTSAEPVTNETMDRGNESASFDETDSPKIGKNKKPSPASTTPAKPHPPPRPVTGINQPKTKVKGDDWWIQRRQQDPDSPIELLPPKRDLTPRSSPSPEKKALTGSLSVPYRSHAILSGGAQRQSSTEILLKDKSKPMIGPLGQYYPPAVRSITPEPFNSMQEEEEDVGKEASNPKVPKRFEKYRRSNSFNGNADKKLRPVSMMEPSVRVE